jgi:hypothetical protein
MSYGYWRMAGLLNWGNLSRLDLLTQTVTKVSVDELSFPLVTHTTYSDAWFDSYGIFELKLRC